MNPARKLTVAVEQLPLSRPFSITGRTTTVVSVLVVTLQSGDIQGRGEATGVGYLGETIAGMLDQVEQVKAEIEQGATRQQLLALLPAGGARNAIDCALWDLEAKWQGQRAWEIAGLDCQPIQTARTIGIEASATIMAEIAADLAAFPLIKIKLDSREPVERVAAIRAARPDARFIVDANQAWTIEQLKDIAPALVPLGVEMIEQPLPRGEDQALIDYQSPITLGADESCQDRNDLDYCLSRYDMVNIKLDKAGGLTEGLLLAQATREAGKQVMVGCMLGSSLAMAPAMVVGQLCTLHDLDAPLFLQSDREPGLSYDSYTITPPQLNLWG